MQFIDLKTQQSRIHKNANPESVTYAPLSAYNERPRKHCCWHKRCAIKNPLKKILQNPVNPV